MNNWQKAFIYVKYELQQSLKAFVGKALYLFFILGLLVMDLNSVHLYDKMAATGFYDLIFFISFTFLPIWMNAREFSSGQKSKNGTEAAPGVILQLHLPVQRDVISKSRILSYIIRSYPFLMILLLMVYITNAPVREEMPPLTYLVFCIIWLGFALYGGGIVLTADFASSGMTVPRVIIGFIAAVGGMALVYSAFTFLTDMGIVYATVAAARNYPVFSVLGSIILVAVGLHYIHHYNIKLMKKNDYL